MRLDNRLGNRKPQAGAARVHRLEDAGGAGRAAYRRYLAGGALATKSAQLPALSPPDVPRSLAHTGGNPWLPIIGFALLASAMVLRRVTVRARAR